MIGRYNQSELLQFLLEWLPDFISMLFKKSFGLPNESSAHELQKAVNEKRKEDRIELVLSSAEISDECLTIMPSRLMCLKRTLNVSSEFDIQFTRLLKLSS